MTRTLAILLLAAVSTAGLQSYDLVVYGGTAGGVMTAVAGARQGLKTALLGPGRHIGGMVSGGLSGTDVGRREVIGGLSLEFYVRAGRHYQLERHLQEIAWMPEPKVAEAVMRKETGHPLFVGPPGPKRDPRTRWGRYGRVWQKVGVHYPPAVGSGIRRLRRAESQPARAVPWCRVESGN